MNELKPEILFCLGARSSAATLTGDRPVVVLMDSYASRLLVEEIRLLFGSRLKEILYCPDRLTTIDLSDQMREQFWRRHSGRDLPTLVAIGGGNTLNLAKSIRVVLKPDTSIRSFIDRKNEIEDFQYCPLLILPTTAGSGSEVSSMATLWDLNNKSKHTLFGPAATADWAVIDPELCLSSSWAITRDSGVEALSLALESIWNQRRVPKAFAFAMAAAQQIIRTLPHLREKPNDLSLRSEMSQASLWAGQATTLTNTSLVHALSSQDMVLGSMSHGEACAKWLPRVYKLARESSEEMSIYLRASMEPFINDERDLEKWLTRLGYSFPLLEHIDHSMDDRIQTTLNLMPENNFVGSRPLASISHISTKSLMSEQEQDRKLKTPPEGRLISASY